MSLTVVAVWSIKFVMQFLSEEELLPQRMAVTGIRKKTKRLGPNFGNNFMTNHETSPMVEARAANTSIFKTQYMIHEINIVPQP